MKALLEKELRELLPTAVLILAGAAVIGATDSIYNWGQYRDVGLSLTICLIAAYPIALLGAANAFARESTENLTYLAALPVRRWTLWAVKLATNLGAAMVAAGLSFFICLVLVRMAGYTDEQLVHLVGSDASPALLVALWFVVYALAFFWSTMVRKPLAAVGLAVGTALALTAGLGYLLLAYLPENWEPWLGFDLNGLLGSDAALFVAIAALAIAAAAFIGAGAAFVRSPVLEAGRRVLRGLAWMLGIISAATVVAMALWWAMAIPSLSVANFAALDRDGRHVELWTYRPEPGLWIADLAAGGKPRLVSRAGSYAHQEGFTWPEVLVRINGGTNWVVNAETRHVRRLRRFPSAVSPSNRLVCYLSRDGLIVEDLAGREVRRLQGYRPAEPHAFSADGRHLYAEQSEQRTRGESPFRPKLVRLDTETGKLTVLSRGWLQGWPVAISPSGRYLAKEGWRSRPGNSKGSEAFVSVLDAATDKVRDAYGVRLVNSGAAVSDRYLWVRSRPSARPEAPASPLEILDTRTMKIVRTLGPKELQAASGGRLTGAEMRGPLRFDVQSRRGSGPVYFTSYLPLPGGSNWRPPIRRIFIWSANPDGTGLRFLKATEDEILGLAATGELVLWEETALKNDIYSRSASIRVLLLDPSTGRERVVVSAP